MARGWYVIWTEDTEEFRTKKDALKRAKQIYKQGLDSDVFIQHFDDNNEDGYFAGEDYIFIKNII